MAVDKLTVALIRSLNAPVIRPEWTDEDLLSMFGQSAQILADAIRETIREEVRRNTENV